jgi:hypothetical protein
MRIYLPEGIMSGEEDEGDVSGLGRWEEDLSGEKWGGCYDDGRGNQVV